MHLTAREDILIFMTRDALCAAFSRSDKCWINNTRNVRTEAIFDGVYRGEINLYWEEAAKHFIMLEKEKLNQK